MIAASHLVNQAVPGNYVRPMVQLMTLLNTNFASSTLGQLRTKSSYPVNAPMDPTIGAQLKARRDAATVQGQQDTALQATQSGFGATGAGGGGD